MKKILLPTDFSENSREAIEDAIDLFKYCKCTFYLLHSFEPQISAPSTAVTSKRANAVIMESMRKEARLGLQKIEKQIHELPKNENHTFETTIVNDYFTSAVKSKVEELNIDVVVVGTKGASGLKEVAIGSNTANLIGKLPCPIIAAPSNTRLDTLKKIGFAVDYSIKSYASGLGLLKELATHYESEVYVVHVKDKEFTPEMESSKTELENYLKPISTSFYHLTDVSVEVGTRVFCESQKLDIMCLVARKKGFLESLFQKSHSKTISHHANVPLIIFNEDSF